MTSTSDEKRDSREILYRFVETDGGVAIDLASGEVNKGPSYIAEDEIVQNTLRAGDIAQAYVRLGYQHGWTFLGTSDQTLRSAQVAIVGLNPGGGGEGDNFAYEGIWDRPDGNGYFEERWGPNKSFSSVQRQVQAWHQLLNLGPTDTLCANFVPFRSSDWASLARQEDALKFARQLWGWVLEISPARLFITMGKTAAAELAGLMQAKFVASLPTGWGRQLIDIYQSLDGKRVIGMPHPSRYGLFGRATDSETAIESFRAATSQVFSVLSRQTR